jgi:SAM-dependent methyltransferase
MNDGTQTNWDAYYDVPYPLARFSRKITASRLMACLRLSRRPVSECCILELGGANSCFYGAIQAALRPRAYVIADINEPGLGRFKDSHPGDENVTLRCVDLLASPDLHFQADVVFSVGLIEHFDRDGTRVIVQSHFKNLKPGGLAVISFPTPTMLYRMTRRASELTGQWIFHDERPLLIQEVDDAVNGRGEKVNDEIIWKIFLTQRMVAYRKPETSTGERL